MVGELDVVDLGTLAYSAALEVQRDAARRRISGEQTEDVLFLVEHPPVVTLGRTAKAENILVSAELLSARGVELSEVERGGDVTFHGPGQLVGYPIIDLKRHRKDLHWYLRQIEEALIRAVAPFGITGGRVPKYTGVCWVGTSAESPRKLASIGVHARDWVTWHGFALNVTTDLSYFDLLVPCGIQDVTMTSVARELEAGSPDMKIVARAVVDAFAEVFDLTPIEVARDVASLHGSGPLSIGAPTF
jgi:lipoyl(octanoyl) transferase